MLRHFLFGLSENTLTSARSRQSLMNGKMQKKELAVKRVLNDGAKAEILRLRDEGMEAAAIGKQLGLARTTVHLQRQMPHQSLQPS